MSRAVTPLPVGGRGEVSNKSGEFQCIRGQADPGCQVGGEAAGGMWRSVSCPTPEPHQMWPDGELCVGTPLAEKAKEPCQLHSG